MGLEPDEIVRMRKEKQEEEDQEVEEVVHRENREYKPERGEIDLSNKRCTQMKTNRRVFMPPYRPVKEECILQTRNQVWMDKWRRYRDEYCKKDGSQEHQQLTKDEIKGKTSLLKRVSAGELYIGPSDKGKGVCVMSVEMYDKMSIVHTEGDTEVDWKTLQATQRELRGHSRAMARIVNLGAGQGNKNRGRCYDNISSWANDPPNLRCVAKTHKPVGKDGIPKSRPIVGATKGLTTAIGELISDIVEPITRSQEDSSEAQSTEELLNKIQEANLRLQSKEMLNKEVMVGSISVVSKHRPGVLRQNCQGGVHKIRP